VPQLFQVTSDYTVLGMVLMVRARQVGLFSQPSAQDEEAAMASLDRFGIADFARHPFHELSGGERQLVIFARALDTITQDRRRALALALEIQASMAAHAERAALADFFNPGA
jgi:ABC-type cobalamin/Fe3+-siderophores transport system ATPase subunit